ncbi:MAG TPA: hypothetical protein PKC30_04830 [Saprospiraceae bacterium]|nr:hypothetical protein [Saprospiraceae bacterium]
MKNLILTLFLGGLFGISNMDAQVFKCDFGMDSLSIGPVICVDSTETGNQYLQFIVTTTGNFGSGTKIIDIPPGSYIKCDDGNFFEIIGEDVYFHSNDTCIVQILSEDCEEVEFNIRVKYQEFGAESCDTTFVNVIFSPVDSIEIKDPCSCDDPGNILDMAGNIILFREVLTVNFANFDDEVTLAMGHENFLDSGGNQMITPTGFTQTLPGVFELVFYRSPGTSFTVTIQRMFPDTAVDAYVFSSMEQCDSQDCIPPPIPAMGAWALIILGILLSILALVGMRQQNWITAR